MATVATELVRAGVKDTAPFEGIGMPFSLRDYQVEGLNKALTNQRFGLYFEPRLGKTHVFMLTAIYCAHYGVKTVLLAPPILHRQLEQEWKNLAGNPYVLHTLSQGPKKRKELYENWRQYPRHGQWRAPDILVMTKEIFIKDSQALQTLGYKALTWDECHMGLQKAGTKIYGAVQRFMNSGDSRLLLSTGTPIPTSPVAAYPVINLTNPGAYYNEAAFQRQHIVYKKIRVKGRRGNMLINVPDKAVRLELLHNNLYANAIRKTRVGDLKMSAPDVAVRDMYLEPAHRTLYKRLIKQRMLEVGSRIINATQAAKLRQVAAQLVMSPQNYNTKLTHRHNALLKMIDEIVSEYHESERFVLVAYYQQSVETLVEYYKEGSPCVVYGGNTPAANRKEAARFQAGGAKYLIMNAGAGGVGLTLGHVCSNVIFVEPTSTYGSFDQALSRVLLIEKKEPVTAYILRPLETGWVRAVKSMLDRASVLRAVNQDSDDLLQELMGD